MFGLNLIGFLSLIKLKKDISKLYIDPIRAMNLLTNLNLMFPLYAPSVKQRLSPFLIYFIHVLIQID